MPETIERKALWLEILLTDLGYQSIILVIDIDLIRSILQVGTKLPLLTDKVNVNIHKQYSTNLED